MPIFTLPIKHLGYQMRRPFAYAANESTQSHYIIYWNHPGGHWAWQKFVLVYVHVLANYSSYSRTPLFRTRLIRSLRYFEGRSNSLWFTLPLWASSVIWKPGYFELFSISLGTSKLRGSTVLYKSQIEWNTSWAFGRKQDIFTCTSNINTLYFICPKRVF